LDPDDGTTTDDELVAGGDDIDDQLNETLIDDTTIDDEDEPSETGEIQGIATFSIVVLDGISESVPFDAYRPELLAAVQRLAQQSIQDVPGLIEERTREGIRELQEEKSTFRLEISSITILSVEKKEFTQNPTTTSLGIFTVGACPILSGNVETDRCEQVSISVKVLVQSGVYEIDVIQEALQDDLDNGVNRGQLHFYMERQFPNSHASIISGRAVDDLLRPGSIVEVTPTNDDDGATRVGIIVGIFVSISVILAVALAIVYFGRQQPVGDDDAVSVDNANGEGSQHAATELQKPDGIDSGKAFGELRRSPSPTMAHATHDLMPSRETVEVAHEMAIDDMSHMTGGEDYNFSESAWSVSTFTASESRSVDMARPVIVGDPTEGVQ
jgi:hypothetical protein